MNVARRASAMGLTVVLVLAFVLPIAWAMLASLSTNTQITVNSLSLPDRLHFENYAYAWTHANIATYIANSLLVSLTSAILIATLATTSAYALARLQFVGRRWALGLVFVTLGAPVFSYLVALNQLITTIGLINTRTAVVLVTAATFLPVATLLLMAFFRDISEEFADAARLDGASEWQLFVHVMAPLVRPGYLLALTFAFVWAWNDVLLPAVFLQSADKFTIPYGIATLRPDPFRQDYVSTFAAVLISAVPMLALYGYLQRRFLEGLTAGAIKG